MRILFDTSVVVAAIVESHPRHEYALEAFRRAGRIANQGVIAAHTLAETYSVLTTLPLQPRISPAIALQVIQRNVIASFEIVALDSHDYMSLLERLAAQGVVGGTTYDALLMHAAAKATVDQIFTLNAQHFRRIYPELADRVVSP